MKLSQPAATQGPADIAFVVEENQSTALRLWEVVVADQRAVVSQDAATCRWSLSPAKMSFDAAGGDAQALLETQEFCSWQLPKPAAWITMDPDRGQGTVEMTVRVSRNTGGARTERVSVSNAAIDVVQREAPVPPSPVPPAPEPPEPLAGTPGARSSGARARASASCNSAHTAAGANMHVRTGLGQFCRRAGERVLVAGSREDSGRVSMDVAVRR